MDLLEVWIAKFEDSKDFKKSPILFVDEKSDFSILGVKDSQSKTVVDIETGEAYRYFDRDKNNKILPHEAPNIVPGVYYALRMEPARLDRIDVLTKLSVALKKRKVEKVMQKKIVENKK